MQNIDNLSVIEQQAFNLAQAGIGLDQSRMDGAEPGALAHALEHNLQTWVELSVVIRSPECFLAEQIRDNLLKLAEFVSGVTFEHGIDIPESAINTLVNIDFQISEGLLEGAGKKKP